MAVYASWPVCVSPVAVGHLWRCMWGSLWYDPSNYMHGGFAPVKIGYSDEALIVLSVLLSVLVAALTATITALIALLGPFVRKPSQLLPDWQKT